MSSNAPHHMRPRTLLSRCELPPPTYVGIVCNTCTMPCLCGSCLVMSCATWQPKLQPRLGSCTISVFACQAGPPHMQSQASPVSQHNGTWRPPVMVSLGSRILDIGPYARLKTGAPPSRFKASRLPFRNVAIQATACLSSRKLGHAPCTPHLVSGKL